MTISGLWVAAWAALIWLSAPLLPALRNYLNERAAGGFDRYVAAGLIAASAVVVGLVWARRRGDRLLALGELALVAAGFAAIYAWLASPDPRSHLVEAAHFAEYGVLAVLAFASLRRLSTLSRWVQTLFLIVAVGLVDEAIQWALASRVAEIRDVALNAAAGGLGLVYAGWVLRPVFGNEETRSTGSRGELRRMATVGGVLLPALAGFLYVVHLGYWIRWDDVEFVSQYRDLDRVGEDRRLRWSSWSEAERSRLLRPGEALWTLEDFYVTEARRHIQARNEAAERGDSHAATGENLIVERWFTPYLDVARAERSDLSLQLDGAYRSRVMAHLWPALGSPAAWGSFIAAELVLVGLAAFFGSRA